MDRGQHSTGIFGAGNRQEGILKSLQSTEGALP